MIGATNEDTGLVMASAGADEATTLLSVVGIEPGNALPFASILDGVEDRGRGADATTEVSSVGIKAGAGNCTCLRSRRRRRR